MRFLRAYKFKVAKQLLLAGFGATRLWMTMALPVMLGGYLVMLSVAKHPPAGRSFGATRLWMTMELPVMLGGYLVMLSVAKHPRAGRSFGATRLWMTEGCTPLDDGGLHTSG